MGCGQTKEKKIPKRKTGRSTIFEPVDEKFRFDKVLVRLENGKVPKVDLNRGCDSVVKMELKGQTYPKVIFGCETINDQSDLTALHSHTFSEKKNTLEPQWNEEYLFLVFRPEGSKSPQTDITLTLTAHDKDTLGSDDILVKSYSVDVFKTCIPTRQWKQFKAPCDGKNSTSEHFISFSVFTETCEEMIVTRSDYEGSNITEEVVTLKNGDTTGGAKAVLLRKTKAENKKAFFWLPGLNASFHHIHCVDLLLKEGWDFYSLDCRRMGRSKRHAPDDWNHLDAHTTGNFKDYCEEIDLLIESSKKTKTYESTVLYGNSTGALTCTTYLRHGKHADFFSGLALNGPFFNWNLAPYAELLMSSEILMSIYSKLVVGEDGRYVRKGEGVSPYSLKTWSQFYYPPGVLRSIACLNTTTEWAMAVTTAQNELIEKKQQPLQIPIFVISSKSDTWVSSDEVLATADCLGPKRTEVEIENAEHDVFMSTTTEKIKECQNHLISWLHRLFP